MRLLNYLLRLHLLKLLRLLLDRLSERLLRFLSLSRRNLDRQVLLILVNNATSIISSRYLTGVPRSYGLSQIFSFYSHLHGIPRDGDIYCLLIVVVNEHILW